MLTGGTNTCWEKRLLWTYWEENQKKKNDDKELDKKEHEKETVWRGGGESKAVSLQKLYGWF